MFFMVMVIMILATIIAFKVSPDVMGKVASVTWNVFIFAFIVGFTIFVIMLANS